MVVLSWESSFDREEDASSVTTGFMVGLTYLFIEAVVSYIVHSIMRLLRY